MPNNPHSTIGGGALTNFQQFRLVQHTMHTSIKFTNAYNDTFEYTKSDIKVINGLDYIPVILHNYPPSTWIQTFLEIINGDKTGAMAI